MMEFLKFKLAVQKHFEEMIKDARHLFVTDANKDKMWEIYLNSFPEGTNPIYKERREYDCNCCKHFIREFGNVVVIKKDTYKLTSIWDLKTDNATFQSVADALSAYVKSLPVRDLYVTKIRKIGTDVSRTTNMLTGETTTFNHFYVEVPKHFTMCRRSDNPNEIRAAYRDTKNVFKRSLNELTTESVESVLELITDNSLYRGEEWRAGIEQFLLYKKDYAKITDENLQDNFAWFHCIQSGIVVGRILNHSIGVLLRDISTNMDLEEAVKRYEHMVAPENYRRPKPIFTKRMLEEAREKVNELGYLQSLQRRFARLDDISANNVLFVNKDVQKKIADPTDIFSDLEKDVAVSPRSFSRVEEVPIDTFVKDVLPHATNVEVLFENRFMPNMVSLITAQNMDAPSMFKWNNPFSWAYTGNITDSTIRENVKSAGGNVNGVLRFSIQWNDQGEYDGNDLDAHCIEPNKNEIMFNKPRSYYTHGNLDIDIIDPKQGVPAVENITFPNKKFLMKGKYLFFVHQYTNRGGTGGFRAEIEFDGNIYSYDYQKELRQNEQVLVAEVTFDGENFTIKELLPSSTSTRKIWGISTNQFVPVSVIMYSPNYWDTQEGIGHRHYFFMLKDCINPETPNGFYNEFLKSELTNHKRVFEALGSKAHVENTDDQLSGIGFSSTRRNTLIAKVTGEFERIIKIII